MHLCVFINVDIILKISDGVWPTNWGWDQGGGGWCWTGDKLSGGGAPFVPPAPFPAVPPEATPQPPLPSHHYPPPPANNQQFTPSQVNHSIANKTID